jgi:hypothetical protein
MYFLIVSNWALASVFAFGLELGECEKQAKLYDLLHESSFAYCVEKTW